MALVERRQEEASLEEIVSRLPVGIDLVITEGYKRAPTPKIEVVRADGNEEWIITEGYKRAPTLKIEVVRADGNEEWIACDKDLLALISDRPISDRKVPQFTGKCRNSPQIKRVQWRTYSSDTVSYRPIRPRKCDVYIYCA